MGRLAAVVICRRSPEELAQGQSEGTGQSQMAKSYLAHTPFEIGDMDLMMPVFSFGGIWDR
jgi:hypothetical protein